MRIKGPWRAGVLMLASLAAATAQAAPPEIALLLPQSGRLAKAAVAIRDGFLAAYYQDSPALAEPPVLHFYDSDSVEITQLLQQAKNDGASLVIGPLDRERLEVLARADTLPLPVLALNAIEDEAGNLYQFALSPEDELQRLAQWMRQQGLRRPLLLTGSDEASQRHLRLFQTYWGAPSPLPVTVLDPARKGGITATVRDITQSAGRHDALFLATPTLARQVQPALTYYHSNLPLYTLASAWDPTADASGQKDLDGARFCDLPWMLGRELAPEQQALYAALGRPAGGYDRLHAFGADAWTLSRHWNRLQEPAPLTLRSGLVQVDELRRLRRTPTCAEVRNGNAFPLTAPDAGPADPGERR